MTNFNILFLFALIFGALIAIGMQITITIFNALTEKNLIHFYKVSVAYIENDKLKMCEVPIAIKGFLMPIKKLAFIDNVIQGHLKVMLEVDDVEPVIVGMNYYGGMKESDFKKLHKEVTVIEKGIG